MTTEQSILYEKVIKYTLLKKENNTIRINIFPIFLDGKAGREKTFLINVICYTIRAAGEIVLIYGTMALSVLLYEGGCTAHSLFQIPVEENNTNLQSTIKINSGRADLLREAKIIIWDELPMANKAVLECVDLLLKEICGKNKPFRGKPFIGVRDF